MPRERFVEGGKGDEVGALVESRGTGENKIGVLEGEEDWRENEKEEENRFESWGPDGEHNKMEK